MNRRTDIEAAVRAAAPHALLATLRTKLSSVYGALAVELHLADYGLRVLKSLDRPDDENEPLSSTTAPRAGRSAARSPVNSRSGTMTPSTTTCP